MKKNHSRRLNRTTVPVRHYHTSDAALRRLWDTINKRRKGTQQVTVPVDDLVPLLRDHATLSDEVDY